MNIGNGRAANNVARANHRDRPRALIGALGIQAQFGQGQIENQAQRAEDDFALLFRYQDLIRLRVLQVLPRDLDRVDLDAFRRPLNRDVRFGF